MIGERPRIDRVVTFTWTPAFCAAYFCLFVCVSVLSLSVNFLQTHTQAHTSVIYDYLDNIYADDTGGGGCQFHLDFLSSRWASLSAPLVLNVSPLSPYPPLLFLAWPPPHLTRVFHFRIYSFFFSLIRIYS